MVKRMLEKPYTHEEAYEAGKWEGNDSFVIFSIWLLFCTFFLNSLKFIELICKKESSRTLKEEY